MPMPTARIPPVIRKHRLTSSVLRVVRPASGPSWGGTCPAVTRSGDVLVSRPTARADVYAISVVPAVAHISRVRYQDGIEAGRQLARELGVDGWFTCDHTHFVRIAC